LNVEGRISVDFYNFKRKSAAIPTFVILRFDIRNSAVRFSARPQTKKAASLIEDEPSLKRKA